MNIIDWFGESNRQWHLVGGLLIGLFANSWYCAGYAGAGVAGAMEFKDYVKGGTPDWIDFDLTFGGALLGYFLKWLVLG